MALKPTGSRGVGTTTATTAIAQAAVTVPAPIFYYSNHSLHSSAIVLFAKLNKIQLEKKIVHGPLAPAGTKPGQSAQLPRLEDGPVVLHGWVTILKYLTQKYTPEKQNTFYPITTTASLTTSAGATGTTAGVPKLTSFAIDSYLDSLSAFQPTLDYLSYAFIQAVTHGDQLGVVPHLKHVFDKRWRSACAAMEATAVVHEKREKSVGYRRRAARTVPILTIMIPPTPLVILTISTRAMISSPSTPAPPLNTCSSVIFGRCATSCAMSSVRL